jgi:hypothetical protein
VLAEDGAILDLSGPVADFDGDFLAVDDSDWGSPGE